MDAIAAAIGAPTILVNNAGMGSSPVAAGLETGPFEDYPKPPGTR
jgi:NAD(P)-dependent dehydrogenase (short-subunit alcohol dehydrogenase family)